MIPSKLLWSGNIEIKNIAIEDECQSKRRIDESFEQRKEEIWNQKVTEAFQYGRKMWDSTAYRIELFAIESSCISISMSTISYKDIIALTEFDYRNCNEDYYPKQGYIGSFIRTKDNHYVFGTKRRANNEIRTEFIGGSLIKSENKIQNSLDFVNALHNEMFEEANICETSITNMYLGSIVQSQTGGIGFYFHTDIDLSFSDILHHFLLQNDGEFQNLICIPSEFLISFLHAEGGTKETLVPSISFQDL